MTGENEVRQNLTEVGHYTQETIRQASNLIAKVNEENFETIRLVFVDQHGILRGKTIVANALFSAFKAGIGVPSTLLLKDTAHRTVFPVWSEKVKVDDLPFGGAGDVILWPDPKRFYPLPWSSHSAILFCNVHHRAGGKVSFSSDNVLEKAVKKLDKAGYQAIFGLEVEFQIYRCVEPSLAHHQASVPPVPVQTTNLTQGSQYLTEIRYGEVEPLLDELRRMAEGLGLRPRSMEIEMGPSQFEMTFEPSDPQTQAEHFVLFRTMVKEVCHAKGLHATFMAKPNLPNVAANGWHIHQSLLDKKTGEALFVPNEKGTLTEATEGWIAGLLKHAAGSCLLTNPTVNSYKRFTPYQLAPNKVQWSVDNRGAMIRALLNAGDHASRIENRVADTTANPYFAFAAQILSGLDGILKSEAAPPASDNPYCDDSDGLPKSLAQAVNAFEVSELYRETLGKPFVDYLATLKRAEWERYLMTVSEWEHQEYFGLF